MVASRLCTYLLIYLITEFQSLPTVLFDAVVWKAQMLMFSVEKWLMSELHFKLWNPLVWQYLCAS